MSAGKTADVGTISIFTKEGVMVHKEKDVLITCKGMPILIGVRDEQGRYQIPLIQQKRHDNRKHLDLSSMQASKKPPAFVTSHPSNKPSNGCMPYVVLPSSQCGLKQSRQETLSAGLCSSKNMCRSTIQKLTRPTRVT
jgi:hypothetical protein